MKVSALLAVVVLSYAWWQIAYFLLRTNPELADLLFGMNPGKLIGLMIAAWLFGAIAVLVSRRVSYAAWVMVVVLLAFAWQRVAVFFFGGPLDKVVAYAIIGWTLVAVVVLVGRRASHVVWIVAGLVLLVVLCLPDTTLLEIAHAVPEPLSDPEMFPYLVVFPLALVVGAMLLYSAFKLYKPWATARAGQGGDVARSHPATGRIAAICVGLSAILLAKLMHSFYWFMVWDTTGDSLNNLWLLLPAVIVVSCSAILFFLLPDRTRLAGLSYLLLIPVLVALSTWAQSVDFRALTKERAEQIDGAIQAYYAREGRYPQDLQQLTPFSLLALSGPVIMYGQGWCYQGGQDYYRFGYLDREHWSSPIRFGRVYSSKGVSPLKVDVCEAALDVYRRENPDWDKWLRVYGKPTPTPDLR